MQPSCGHDACRRGVVTARAGTAASSAEPGVSVEAPVPNETPIEPAAEDASVMPGAPKAEAPRAGRKRGGGKSGAAGVEPVAAVEAPVQAAPPETLSEPAAEDVAVAASASVADVSRGEPELDAAETVPVIAEPAFAVEMAAPESPSETPVADATDAPSGDGDREAVETALPDPTQDVAVEAGAPVEATVEPPCEVAAVTPSAPEAGTPRTGRKRAAASANRQSRSRRP
jgi:hypothetical protein